MAFRLVRIAAFLALTASPLVAQTVDDGLMLQRRTLAAGVMYSHESWDQYWEGTLKRTNGNIGTLTTRNLTWMGGYGITDRIGLLATLPYIWSHASQGVLRDMSGLQDLTLAAKVQLFTTGLTNHGALSAFLVGTGAIPMSHYTPDFMPLSIGTAGRRASARATLNYRSSALFATLSSAYTFCANVRLNRSSYYANGQLYNTNEVEMPNVVVNSIRAGFASGHWSLPLTLTQQHTLGGSDIRRQDMPFVSNRMDFTKLDGGAMYELPKNFSVRVEAGHVLSGRNVGQSTTFTSGLMYAFHL